MIESGVPLTSMQVQYSLLDRRPAKRMVAAALEHGVSLFCYGTVAGGFLGDRWLGAAGAQSRLGEPLADQIQADHRRFRRLGFVPGAAARRCAGSPTGTAPTSRPWRAPRCCRSPGVAAVIVGARNRSHLAVQPRDLRARADRAGPRARSTPCCAQANELDGDVYTLERDRAGRHGSIMKYNLNKGAA